MGWIGQGERRLTTEAIMGRASKAATVLERLGVGAGDGVALYMRNEVTFFEASIATGMLGAYAVPVNWHYAADEAQYLLVDSGVKVLVIHADLLPLVAPVVPPGVTVLVVETPTDILQIYGLPPASGRAPAGATLWRTLVDAAPERKAPPAIAPSSIIYTSGTTGRPKGVRRPAYSAEAQEVLSRMLGLSYGYTEVLQGRRDPATITTAVIGPLYHAAPNGHGGFSIRLGVNVLVEPRFDAEGLLALIERERITHLNMVPVMFVRLLKLPEEVKRRYDLSSLEYVAHAAAPCPSDVKRAMIDWWGPVIWEYYGSTEMGNVSHLSSQEWLSHPGSVGRVMMPGVQLRIVDEQGRDVPHGTVGEVVGGSPLLANFTYQNAPEKRREMDRGGLVAPGDIGYFDADGYLYLCDRKNHMIISGGANIYPAEIEAEIQKLPGVADCAVFGIPDEEFGEAVCAHVQPDPGVVLDAQALRTALRKVLTGYKVPKVFEFTAELPREDSGKIFKRKLREPYWAGRERAI